LKERKSNKEVGIRVDYTMEDDLLSGKEMLKDVRGRVDDTTAEKQLSEITVGVEELAEDEFIPQDLLDIHQATVKVIREFAERKNLSRERAESIVV
jgi:hypothetical protein